MNEVKRVVGYYGKVTEVLDDNFVIRFEVPGFIENGKAFPFHTMHQPKEGDEIIVFGGDDLLNNLYTYIHVQSSEDRTAQDKKSIVMLAFENYIQNIKDGGIQIVVPVNEDNKGGQCYLKSGKTMVLDASTDDGKGLGLHAGKGKIDISNEKTTLFKLVESIYKMLLNINKSAEVMHMPVTIIDQSALKEIKKNMEDLLGDVSMKDVMDDENPDQEDGGDQNTDAPSQKSFGASAEDCYNDLASGLDHTITAVQNLYTCLSAIISPMGPCTCPSAPALMATDVASLNADKAQLKAHLPLIKPQG